MLLGALLLAAAPSTAEIRLDRGAFFAGSLVLPMDDAQADKLSAYGLVHALLRAGIPVHRAITPPDTWLVTSPDVPPRPVLHRGGPFLVESAWRAAALGVAAAFPTVTVERLYELEILDNVFTIRQPTGILLVNGWNPIRQEAVDYGRTEVLLDRMAIPYEQATVAQVEANPALLVDYQLVVVDCPGWYPREVPAPIQDTLLLFLEEGGHVAFTDRALVDARPLFPDRFGVGISGYRATVNATIRPGGGPLAQYSGETEVQVRIDDLDGWLITSVDANVTVLLDTDEFPAGLEAAPSYRILAAQFPVGNGSVELFAYHPSEQPPGSADFTSILYGNVFVHALPFVTPPSPPVPPPVGAGGPLAPPPSPPPPPPPPSLAVPNSSSLGYLFSGFAAVGLTEMMKGRIKLRRREKIAVRV